MSTKSQKRSLDTSKTANKKQKAHWSLGLLSSLNDPELFIQADDLVTVIKDKYPKAEYHYLIIPKEDVSSLKAVSKKHLQLLQHMDEIANKLCEENTNKTFKIGYHAEPSMVRLHLHVISDDMNSPSLKTKKHWNSFNTEFFLDSKSICKELEDRETIALPSPQKCKEYLNTALKRNRCSFVPKHMPDLKKHLLIHLKR